MRRFTGSRLRRTASALLTVYRARYYSCPDAVSSRSGERARNRPGKVRNMNASSNALDFRDPGTMSEELLNVPGFVNELKDYTLAVSPRPNPPLAFAGSIP